MIGHKAPPLIIPAQLTQRRKGSPPPAPRIDAPVEKFISGYLEGKSIRAIGDELGFTGNLVRSRLLEAGVKLRNPWRDGKSPGVEVLRSLYVDRRMSLRQVGKEIGVESPTVKAWLRDAGIETRSISDAKAGQKPAAHTVLASVESRRKNRLPGRPAVGYKLNADGYVLLWNRETQSYQRENRLTLEEKLGRKLSAKEIAHHENEIRHDNRPENVELFGSTSEHIKHHAKKRALDNAGPVDPTTRGL